ncbi:MULTISPECIES: hypothetical protein [unclassified Nocardioides]|uniref:hypothetical protein n=1 Tax=unclassified Nocardioides TaxID=2615069 RepID=UPI003014C498
MIDHDSIAPPPSLADILSGGEDLIGRVDFGSRLVPEARDDAADSTDSTRGTGGTATATRTRTPQVAAKPAPKPAPKAPEAPKPAETSAAESETETGTAAKPGRSPRSKTKPRGSARATLRPALKRVTEEPVAEAPVLAPVVKEEPDAVEIEMELDDEPTVAPQSFLDEEPDEPPFGHSYVDPYATSFADPYAGRVGAPRELPSMTAPSTVPQDDVAYLGLSVEEVADSARARMRAAEVAHLRHLEAIENEAARRLELLTAQAELDAELIRLHARREAHAIITAARTRTGSAGGATRAERRLADVGGSFSRFAESLESSIESSSAPDHRYRP